MTERMSGGCACGRVRFTAEVEPAEAYLCHCRMCQRATGSVSIAFVHAQLDSIKWGHEPDWYDSSPIARRPFCRECGTSLGFAFKEGSDKMDLTVAAFDDPSPFKPKHHFGAESIHRAWLNTEGLPEMRTQDYQKLVDKWVDATGEFPG
ncbi:GFA family protein [Sphingomonas lutea]|uniref:GFA family protein n=1 Tax=Sphingomonas lutea TaxID=1045317 RepID=A0A7G9SFA5_9SPHN|nr:GFA family protein [Sphingomonas lutea]QNN66530.1 GFA family protein [Sphingomonas lutea]